MDLRDDIHTQLAEHIKTLHVLSQLDTPAQLVWTEIQRYLLEESSAYLETFVLPKVDAKTPHVDLRGNGMAPKIATFIGATSVEAADEGERAALEAEEPSFLHTNGGVRK